MSTARDWWLRSPSPGSAVFVRSVSTSGAVDYVYAYDGLAAAADCENGRVK